MLKRLSHELDASGAQTRICDAAFPAPFREGLEYSSPARGTWNIVHTGMLIPESHQIFVCAKGCLRGVVLTAAEMNALDRYSAVEIREENVLEGTMEELMVGGVTDVLQKLPYRPRAVLLFISCQHFFLAYDQDFVFRTLRERFPDVRFVDCYMIPTLRKSGITPDQKMRVQMYRLLEPRKMDPARVNLIGSNHAIEKSCELFTLLSAAGRRAQALNWCESFDEYLDMARAPLNLFYEPLATEAAKDLKARLGQDYIYLPMLFSGDDLDAAYQKLWEMLTGGGSGFPLDLAALRREAEDALAAAREEIGDTPIALDYTFTFRILSFARLLLSFGFHVTEIYADVFLPEEKEDFLWIRERFPGIRISATNRPKLRFLPRTRREKTLAVGQKAAYFTGTDYFVNVVEGGGLFGYDGIARIARLMQDAFRYPKDRKTIVQRKGYGCESCI